MDDKTPCESTFRRLHFAFVTDGNADQLLGIASLLYNLITPSYKQSKPSPVWVLAPQFPVVQALKHLLALDLDIRYLRVAQRDDDKYYIQMGLTGLFEVLDERDTLVVLDYDHITLTRKGMPFHCLDSGVIVSSEISELPHLLGDSHTHPNISLLWGRVRDLSAIAAKWHEAYEELVPLISPRHRVEIAFGVAAQRARVDLKPCSIAIQANFANPSLNTCIFHFGGETNESEQLKEHLRAYARQFMASGERSLLETNDYLARVLVDSLTQGPTTTT